MAIKEQGKEMLKLKVGEISNPFPIANKPFEIDIYLVDESDQLKRGEELSIKVTALLDNETRDSPNDLLDILENTGIQKNGAARIIVQFKSVSINFDNNKFLLQFEEVSGTKVQPVHSSPMYCVQHRLVVKEENKTPYVWYKDEGGKDKCIEIQVFLQDGDGKTVLNRKVPLKAILNYSSGIQVTHQTILFVSPESRTVIDEHGCAILKLRINEVSNRHRGQLFQIEITPDVNLAPLAADISPAYCVPVDVKSKRNSTNKSKQLDSQAKRQKTGPNEYVSNSITHLPPSNSAPLAEMKFSHFSQPMPNNPSHSGPSNPNFSLEPNSVGTAVNSIVNWATTIMKGVDRIQWREIGYERGPDGSANENRPLYNIPNPNAILKDIVDQYSQQVIGSLRFLQWYAEQTSHNQEIATPVFSRKDESVKTHLDQFMDSPLNLLSSSAATLFSQKNMQEDILGIARDQSSSLIIDGFEMPNLNRNSSSSSLLDRPRFSRNNSLFLESNSISNPSVIPTFQSPSWDNNQLFELNTEHYNALETQVNYVISSAYRQSNTLFGLPAYNSKKKLIGFFRHSHDPNSERKLFIIPISSMNIVSKIDIQINESNLEELLLHQSPMVINVNKIGSLANVREYISSVLEKEYYEHTNFDECDDENDEE